jgi:hypothetical protein
VPVADECVVHLQFVVHHQVEALRACAEGARRASSSRVSSAQHTQRMTAAGRAQPPTTAPPAAHAQQHTQRAHAHTHMCADNATGMTHSHRRTQLPTCGTGGRCWSRRWYDATALSFCFSDAMRAANRLRAAAFRGPLLASNMLSSARTATFGRGAPVKRPLLPAAAMAVAPGRAAGRTLRANIVIYEVPAND